MRKFYNFLLLALVFMASITAVQAEKRYRVEGANLDEGYGWSVDNLQIGVPFVIQSGHMGDGGKDFIKGSAKSTSINEENLFLLETDGTNDAGETQYLLKRYSSGEYLAASSYSYTTSKSRAWRFVILEPTTYTDADVALTGEECPVLDWRAATTVVQAYNSLVVFVDAAAVADTTVTTKSNVKFLLSGSEGITPSFGNTLSQNALELFGVEEITGYEYLEEVFDELFPDEETGPDIYNVGSDPGQISQELYDELVAAYNEAKELIDTQSSDQAACEAAVTRCNNAIEAAQNGAVKMQEGYYYFGGTRTSKDANGNPTNATYDDGSGCHWTYGTTWTRPDPLDMDNAKYVWKLIPDAANDGAYFIQNFYTKHYMGIAKSRGAYVEVTDDPEESYLIYPYDKDYFVIESTTLIQTPVEGWNGVQCTCLHQPEDHNNLVVWSTDGEASHWQFLAVPQEEIDALETQIAQAKLNDQLEELVDEAQASYDKGFTHSFIGGTRDGLIDMEDDGVTPKGLVTSIDQLSFNATETKEGSVDALLDGSLTVGATDKTNFYHSIWASDTASGAEYDNTATYPYIQADLGKAVSEVSVKMWPRWDTTNGYYTSNLPGLMLVSASNDGENWTELGKVTTQIAWKYDMIDDTTGETTTSTNNVVGYVTIDFDGASYQHVRLEVTTRNGSTADFKTLSLGQACFNMGEIRFFESQYDASLSIIEAVPADVRTEFETQLESANAQLEEESATQEQIDALQAAYDNFLANYPDPDIVQDLLEQAQDLYDNAEEGDDLGYYETGARAELLAQIEAVSAQIKDVMSVEEVNAAKATLNAAMTAFNAKLHKPSVGSLYFIKSLTNSTADNAATNAYLYAVGNGARVKWAKSEELDPTTIPQYVWRLEAQGENYILRNMLTNEVMNTPRASGSAIRMTTEADTCSFSISTSQAGVFNIVMSNKVYLNAEPASNNVVTWSSASGLDNSAFTFVPVTEEYAGSFEWSVSAGEWNIVTLPVSGTVDGTIYSVAGLSEDGTSLILKTIEDSKVEAGTPFFFQAEEGEGGDVMFVDTDASSYEALASSAVTEAKTVNGLVGTLAAISPLHVDNGILYNGTTIVASIEGEGVGNNSGYICESVPTTTEIGDAQIAVDGKITFISTVNTNAAAASSDVYSLSGMKVRTNVKSINDLKNLPAGVYIMGNKKVIVK